VSFTGVRILEKSLWPSTPPREINVDTPERGWVCRHVGRVQDGVGDVEGAAEGDLGIHRALPPRVVARTAGPVDGHRSAKAGQVAHWPARSSRSDAENGPGGRQNPRNDLGLTRLRAGPQAGRRRRGGSLGEEPCYETPDPQNESGADRFRLLLASRVVFGGE